MSNATTPAEMPLRIATFNLWGIFNSKMRAARMKVFASKIDHYDVLLLQEQFSPDDFDLIYQSATREVQETYHFRRFRSSFYGSGCAVISRYPIKQAFFHTYPLQGYPEMVLHGDFFANKGAAMVRLQIPVPGGENGDAVALQEVSFYTTHFVAIYQKVSRLSSWKKERYLPYRISQAISFANLIMSTSRPTDRIIIGGDFNCSQRSLEVQMMLILLKRHGYDMHSALPTPRELLDTAVTEEQRDRALRLFTFSNRNAFNTMKTSYFKLLNLEADVPSQIDHIFYSKPVFALRDFEDCPDVDAAYPRRLHDAPNGLVIFTKNEVYVPPQPSWWGSVWHKLVTGRFRTSWGSATQQGKAAAPEAEAHLYPLSDHYGVAALLGMRVDSVDGVSSPVTIPASAAAKFKPPTLSEDEVKVMQTVIDYLDDYVATLRSQIRTTRYMALTSILVIATNMLVLHRLSVKEEMRTVAVLEQMYNVAAVSVTNAARATEKQGDVLHAVSTQLVRAGGWAARQLHITFPQSSPPAGSPPPSPAGSTPVAPAAPERRAVASAATPKSSVAVQTAAPTAPAAAPAEMEKTPAGAVARKATPEETRPDFKAIASALVLRPLWATTWVSSVVNICASVGGTAAFAIGMFQRAGNANILEEQVQQLKLL